MLTTEPYRWTGIITFVFLVILAFSLSIDIVGLKVEISTKTGFKPALSTAKAVEQLRQQTHAHLEGEKAKIVSEMAEQLHQKHTKLERAEEELKLLKQQVESLAAQKEKAIAEAAEQKKLASEFQAQIDQSITAGADDPDDAEGHTQASAAKDE